MKTQLTIIPIITLFLASEAHSIRFYRPRYVPKPLPTNTFKVPKFDTTGYLAKNRKSLPNHNLIYSDTLSSKELLKIGQPIEVRLKNVDYSSFKIPKYDSKYYLENRRKIRMRMRESLTVQENSCVKNLQTLLGKAQKRITKVNTVIDLCPKSDAQFTKMYGSQPTAEQSAFIKKFKNTSTETEHTSESILKAIENTPDGEVTMLVGHNIKNSKGEQKLIFPNSKDPLDLNKVYKLAKEKKKNVFIVTCHSPQINPDSAISIQEAHTIVNRLKTYIKNKGATHADLVKIAQASLKNERGAKAIKKIAIYTTSATGVIVVWNSDDDDKEQGKE